MNTKSRIGVSSKRYYTFMIDSAFERLATQVA